MNIGALVTLFQGPLPPPHPVISAPEHVRDGHAQARDERDEHVTGCCWRSSRSSRPRHGPILSKSVTICVKNEHWSARHAFAVLWPKLSVAWSYHAWKRWGSSSREGNADGQSMLRCWDGQSLRVSGRGDGPRMLVTRVCGASMFGMRRKSESQRTSRKLSSGQHTTASSQFIWCKSSLRTGMSGDSSASVAGRDGEQFALSGTLKTCNQVRYQSTKWRQFISIKKN